jgi:hypothetical protein
LNAAMVQFVEITVQPILILGDVFVFNIRESPDDKNRCCWTAGEPARSANW